MLPRHCCWPCPPPDGVGEGEEARGGEEEREVGSEGGREGRREGESE